MHTQWILKTSTDDKKTKTINIANENEENENQGNIQRIKYNSQNIIYEWKREEKKKNEFNPFGWGF